MFRIAGHPQILGMSAEPRRYCYPTDTSEEEWAFAAPYLTPLPEDAGQRRRHDLRASYDALRWIVRAGAAWRLLPGDSPPWHAVYDQARRWLAAGCFEAMAYDLRAVLRLAEGRAAEPSAAIFDSRTLRSTPESGGRAGYDGAKRQKGSKLHAAVDTLGHLLALHVTPADEQDRAQVGHLARRGRPGGHRRSRRPRLCRPGLYRRSPGRGGQGQRHRSACRPHPRGQAWLRPAAAQVGRRAFLRLGRPLPTPRPRLRAAAADRRWPALRRLRHPHQPVDEVAAQPEWSRSMLRAKAAV